jgi:hypothetical protein
MPSPDKKENTDPWINEIMSRAKQLSSESAVKEYIQQRRPQDEDPPEPIVVAQSRAFVRFTLLEEGVGDLDDCLLSDTTDEALDAAILGFKMTGKLSDPRYDEFKQKARLAKRLPSILHKCLARLALIAELGVLHSRSPSISMRPINLDSRRSR